MKSFLRYSLFGIFMILAIICFFADHDWISHPSFQVIGLLSPYIFVLSLLIGAYYGIRTRYDLMIWFFICVGFTWESIIGLVGVDFQEDFAPDPEYRLKVMSLNAAQLEYTKDDIQKFADAVAQYKADIICLQEIGIKKNWTNKDSVGFAMAKAFNMPYFSFSRHPNNIYGLAIFSKIPINSSEEIFLPIGNMNGAISYHLTIKSNKNLTIYNIHLQSFNLAEQEDKSFGHLTGIIGEQQEEVQLIRENLENKHAMLILGDMNSPPYLHTYKQLSEGFQDGFDKVHFEYGATLHNWMLPYKIDVQLYNDYIKCVSYENLAFEYSDHNIQLGVYEIY